MTIGQYLYFLHKNILLEDLLYLFILLGKFQI